MRRFLPCAKITIIHLCLGLALLVAVAAQAYALSINDIRFGTNPPVPGGAPHRLVIETDRPVGALKIFTLTGPDRLVIDVPADSFRVPPKAAGTIGPFANMRNGRADGGMTRIVFDSASPVDVHNQFTLPAESGAPHRIVIDFALRAATMQPAPMPTVPVAVSPMPPAPMASPPSAAFSQPFGAPPSTAPPLQPVMQPAMPAATPDYVSTLPQAMVGVPQPKPVVPAAAATFAAPLPSSTNDKRVYTVIVDPGHGGQDPGAIAHNGVHEKNITLAVSKMLKDALESTGRYKVHLTRDNDRYIKLQDRVAIARQKKADLFISIHADKIEKSHIRGASFYTLSQNASDALAGRLAENENMAGVIAGVDIKSADAGITDILIDFALREQIAESQFFAEFVRQSFSGNGINVLENPKRSAGFAVLKAPDIPSVLIELGFLSNPQEAKLLSARDFQQKLARAIAGGVDEYFEKLAEVRGI